MMQEPPPFTVMRVGEAQVSQLYDLLSWRKTGAETDVSPIVAGDIGRTHKLAKMREHLRSGFLYVWAARWDGEERLAGYVSVARILKPDGRAFFYIDELWVPRPYRRNGVATFLLRETTVTARALGLCCVRLMAANTAAAGNLYRKAGFRVEPSGWAELTL
jgi:ribosomal protein S18 acetylase RimI-like enzyme